MTDTLKPLIAKAADGPLTRAEAEAALKFCLQAGPALPRLVAF